MRARVVIGANFGDEGKGLITDYLCALGAGVVVRFNGGAQAGHTVVTPAGRRHVFHHFGSGTFVGVPTFLSQFFICNPIVWHRELAELTTLGSKPLLYAHPSCLITTFADMIINQKLEDARGSKRHGSVGVGINETIVRSEIDELEITMADLWNRVSLEYRLTEICGRYAESRCGEVIAKPEAMIAEFMRCCDAFAENVSPLGMSQCRDIVFEGAQGLLLDQNNKQFYPYLTRSNTGMHNVRVLCELANIETQDIYYVSRTYLTRHGAGPLPGEDSEIHEDDKIRFDDDTNVNHPYQGRLRFAPLDPTGLYRRCRSDAKQPFKLVMTHCDQLAPPCGADLYSFGPTRDNVTEKT